MVRRVLLFLMAVATAAHAQTVVSGKTAVGGATGVYGVPAGGTIVMGRSTVSGTTTVNSRYSRDVRIFATYPPPYNASHTSNFYYFVHNVLTEPSIDGVDLPITWSEIEPPSTGTPGSYPPTSAMAGTTCYGYTHDTDTCVKDAMGFYHSYSWAAYEGGCGTSNNIQVWFGLCPGDFAMTKIVNLYFLGMDAGATNGSTPEYVTDPYYVSKFTSNPVQDVMNAYNQGYCMLREWTGYGNITLTQGLAIVTGSPLPNQSWQPNDTIWMSGILGSHCSASPAGAQLTAVTTGTPGSFSYAFTGCTSSSGATVIGASDSFAVPYELPYVTAYRAALTALFLHFNSTYTPPGATSSVSSQLGYIRFGQSVGAEAYPYCSEYMYSLGNGYNLGGMADWPCNWTGFTSADGCPNSGGPSPGFYGGNLQWAQSQYPYMRIYAPLNEYGGNNPAGNAYGMREAEQALQYSNGGGVPDGFGSQGLSLTDTSIANGCSNAVSYWCSAFQIYHGAQAPLELQQISLSDPLDSTCAYPQSPNNPAGCASPPNGDSGDLRIWLPFAVANYADVIELFYLDAALAFDPNYCTAFTGVEGSACVPGPGGSGYTITNSGTFLTAAQQGQFFNTVGQGANCPGGPGGGIGQGNCSYATAINNAHGPH